MPATAKPAKDKTVKTAVYLDRDLNKKLWLDRANTQKTISEIVNSVIREHYAKPKPPSRVPA